MNPAWKQDGCILV